MNIKKIGLAIISTLCMVMTIGITASAKEVVNGKGTGYEAEGIEYLCNQYVDYYRYGKYFYDIDTRKTSHRAYNDEESFVLNYDNGKVYNKNARSKKGWHYYYFCLPYYNDVDSDHDGVLNKDEIVGQYYMSDEDDGILHYYEDGTTLEEWFKKNNYSFTQETRGSFIYGERGSNSCGIYHYYLIYDPENMSIVPYDMTENDFNEKFYAYVGDDEYFYTGWHKIDGYWYYFNRIGIAQTGWKEIDGKWYFFDEEAQMQKNCTVVTGGKCYTLDKSGAWYGSSTKAKNGWNKSGEGWTYVENGKCVKGWKKVNGKWYYFDKNGQMYSSRIMEIGGKYYYLKSGPMSRFSTN